MKKRSAQVFYMVLGIAISVVLLVTLVKYSVEAFATTKVVSIYLRYTSATSNISFVKSTDAAVTVTAPAVGGVTINLPSNYRTGLQDYIVYGYGTSWTKAKYDAGVSGTYVKLSTGGKFIRPNGASGVMSSQIALTPSGPVLGGTSTSAPISSILVQQLTQANFATFRNDPANGNANIRIDLSITA